MSLEVKTTDLNLYFYISPIKVKIRLKLIFAESIMNLNVVFSKKSMKLGLVFLKPKTK